MPSRVRSPLLLLLLLPLLLPLPRLLLLLLLQLLLPLPLLLPLLLPRAVTRLSSIEVASMRGLPVISLPARSLEQTDKDKLP